MKKGLIVVLLSGALLASCGQENETPVVEDENANTPVVNVETEGGQPVEVVVNGEEQTGEEIATPEVEVDADAQADAEAMVDAVEAAVEAGSEDEVK